jgi:hypothetical protein
MSQTKISSTEKGSILSEISTQRPSSSGPVSWASRLKACSFHSVESLPSSVTTIVGYYSLHRQTSALSNHYLHWIPPSLVTTLFIDRRPLITTFKVSISGNYVIVYCFVRCQGQDFASPRHQWEDQVLPKHAMVHATLWFGFTGTTTRSPSWAAPYVEHQHANCEFYLPIHSSSTASFRRAHYTCGCGFYPTLWILSTAPFVEHIIPILVDVGNVIVPHHRFPGCPAQFQMPW